MDWEKLMHASSATPTEVALPAADSRNAGHILAELAAALAAAVCAARLPGW
jgi:hypothetical protein